MPKPDRRARRRIRHRAAERLRRLHLVVVSSRLGRSDARPDHAQRFIQQLVRELVLHIEQVPAAENPADIGTKYLEKTTLVRHRTGSGDLLVVLRQAESQVNSITRIPAVSNAFSTWLAAMLASMQISGASPCTSAWASPTT